jgi:peroxiredoxin
MTCSVKSENDREVLMRSSMSNRDRSLWDLSHESPLLVIFLRHLGCTFCKEAVRDAAEQRADIQAGGATIVFVHMSGESEAEPFFGQYGMADVDRISDPEGRLYSAFGLERAGVRQLLSPSVWLRGVSAMVSGNVPGIPRGDTFRMPGAFVVNRGRVAKSFFHRTIAERPNMAGFAHEGLEACRA